MNFPKISERNIGFIVGTSILFIFLVLYAIGFFKHSIGVTPDSTSYILSAENFLKSFSFYETPGRPLVEWPFFYPFILALTKLVSRLEWEATAFFLNEILLLVCFFLAIKIFNELGPPSKSLKIWLVIAYFGFPTSYVYAFAWSEPLFNLFCFLIFINLIKYFKKQEKSTLIILSMLATLLTLTRYAGFFITIGIAISLLYLLRSDRKEALKSAIAFLALPSLMLSAWLVRNFLLTGTLTGPRNPLHIFSYSENLYNLIDQTMAWFFPHKLPPSVASLISGVSKEISVPFLPRFTIFLLITIFLIIIYFNQVKKSKENKASSLGVYLAIPIIVYFIFIFATSTRVYFEPNRFFSPVYPLFLVALSWLFYHSLNYFEKKFNPSLKNLLLILILLHSIYFPVSSYLRILNPYQTGGLGINNSSFKSLITNVVSIKRERKIKIIETDNESILAYLVKHKNVKDLSLRQTDNKKAKLVFLFKPHTRLSDFISKNQKITDQFRLEGVRIYVVEQAKN